MSFTNGRKSHFEKKTKLYEWIIFFIHKLYIIQPSGARCAKSCGWGCLSTFPRWRSRVFLSDLTDPHQIFDAHLLENTDLSPSRFNFSVGFISRSYLWVRWFYSLFERKGLKRKITMFILTNKPLITSFYKKVLIFRRISDESAPIRNFLRNGRVRR